MSYTKKQTFSHIHSASVAA